jgi:DNA-binding transcriptional ArsR family regulator
VVKHEAEKLDAVFAALADPTRRDMLRRLCSGEATVSVLAEPYQMSLPAVSKHLAVLEQAGLISREKQGRSWHCKALPESLTEAVDWIDATREFWRAQLDSMAQYLEQLQRERDRSSKG